jgi:hypothetical protein
MLVRMAFGKQFQHFALRVRRDLRPRITFAVRLKKLRCAVAMTKVQGPRATRRKSMVVSSIPTVTIAKKHQDQHAGTPDRRV